MVEKICPNCGTKLSEFCKTGMLGCPNCYNAFYDDIISSLKNYQGNSFHVGKAPKCCGIDKQLLGEYKKLLKEKEQAGIEGRFKDMAEISKSINELYLELKDRRLI